MFTIDQITPHILIADLLKKWPETTPILIKHRMNCVGCSMAPFENLSDALSIYHIPLEPFMNELELAICNHQVNKSNRYRASI